MASFLSFQALASLYSPPKTKSVTTSNSAVKYKIPLLDTPLSFSFQVTHEPDAAYVAERVSCQAPYILPALPKPQPAYYLFVSPTSLSSIRSVFFYTMNSHSQI